MCVTRFSIYHYHRHTLTNSSLIALLNIIETLLNVIYLYAAHVSAWPPATLIGFTSASLTLAKTVLYWAQEYYCNLCATGQNDAYTMIVYWIIPNGWVLTLYDSRLGLILEIFVCRLWIVVPAAIVYVLWNDLVAQLTFADKAARAVTADKKR